MNPAEFANIANCERDFWWYRGMRKILFRLLDRHLAGRRIGRALEAGCGTGYLSRLFQKERHWPVVPMDISPDGLRYARAMGVERPVQGDATCLPFAGGAFDLVLSLDVLAHLPRGMEPRRGARDGARAGARRPDGRRAPPRSTSCAAAIPNSLTNASASPAGRLRELFEAAGFRVVRCDLCQLAADAGGAGEISPVGAAAAPPGLHRAGTVAPWLDRLLYAPLAVEAAWIGGGGSFPAGPIAAAGWRENGMTVEPRKFASLSVFFPAYNDAPSLPGLIHKTFAVLERHVDDYEVIVVNDGSQDNTGEVLEDLRREFAPRMRVVTHPQNRGYGGALRTGFAVGHARSLSSIPMATASTTWRNCRACWSWPDPPPGWSTATSWSGTTRRTASGSAPFTTSARACCSASASAISIATIA